MGKVSDQYKWTQDRSLWGHSRDTCSKHRLEGELGASTCVLALVGTFYIFPLRWQELGYKSEVGRKVARLVQSCKSLECQYQPSGSSLDC